MKTCYAERLSDPAGLAIADLVELDDGILVISRINVPVAHRGRGHARMLLNSICADADAEGVELRLEISPSDGLGYDALRRWYERHDFNRMWTRGCWRRRPRTVR